MIMKIYIDTKAIEQLKNPDCLSVDAIIFRNEGSTVSGAKAIPCEVLEEVTEDWVCRISVDKDNFLKVTPEQL